MSKLITIDGSPAIHQKGSDHVSALNSSATNLKAHSVAEEVEHLALTGKHALDMNTNPRLEGIEGLGVVCYVSAI